MPSLGNDGHALTRQDTGPRTQPSQQVIRSVWGGLLPVLMPAATPPQAGDRLLTRVSRDDNGRVVAHGPHHCRLVGSHG